MSLPWPDRYSDQADYVTDLEQRLRLLHLKSVPASYVGISRPTTAQMADAWSLKEDADLSVPPYGKTQWYNPQTDRVENLFVNLPTYAADPFGVQADALSPVCTELIGSFSQNQGDGASATYTASWSKVYRKISFFWSARSTAAVTGATFQIRPNALATAIYNHAASRIDSTTPGQADTSSAAANGWAVGNIPGTTAANANVFGQGFGEIYFPDSVKVKGGFFDSLWLINDGSGAAEMRHNHGGWIINTTAQLTSLLFVPQTGFAVGSKIVVFGHHPTT